jgi:hypothetical protein
MQEPTGVCSAQQAKIAKEIFRVQAETVGAIASGDRLP